MIWLTTDLESPMTFCRAIKMLAPKEELLVTYRPSNISITLINAFKTAFPWHYRDTERSYTQKTLRAAGNRGKRTDFAYYNRATKYFEYDQFETHRAQPNKMICLWDPTYEGDMYGEHNPCLVTIKFKVVDGCLDLVATYRKRDVCRRMIGNMVFLGVWLADQAQKWRVKPGKIVDFSMETQWSKEDVATLRRAK